MSPMPIPSAEAFARKEGREAAEAVLAGRRPKRCRWDRDGESLTAARLARAWSEGFLEVKPIPKGDLPA